MSVDQNAEADGEHGTEESREEEGSKPPSRRSIRLATPMDDWNFKFSLQLMREFVFLAEKVRELREDHVADMFGTSAECSSIELVRSLFLRKSREEDQASASQLPSTSASSARARHHNVADVQTWQDTIERLKTVNSRISSAIERLLGTPEEEEGRLERFGGAVRESLEVFDQCRPIEFSLLLHLVRAVDERPLPEVDASTVKSFGLSTSRRGKAFDDDTIEEVTSKFTELLENAMNQLIEAKERAVMDAVKINEDLKQKVEEIDRGRSLRDQEEKATILATEDIVQSGRNMASIMRAEAAQAFQKAKLDLERSRVFWEKTLAEASKQFEEEKKKIDGEMKERIRSVRKEEQDAEARLKHQKRKLAIARDEFEKQMEAVMRCVAFYHGVCSIFSRRPFKCKPFSTMQIRWQTRPSPERRRTWRS